MIGEFEKSHSYNVKFSAVGSGAVIQLARDGEVDAIIVHAPDLGQGLIDDSISNKRHTLWFNYFIVVCPASDPANIQNSDTLIEMMHKLNLEGKKRVSNFYSRCDESGTHLKELQLRDESNLTIDPSKEQMWYFETGTGMSSTLTIVDNDPLGYTLTDLGTYAALQSTSSKLVMYEIYGEDSLPYNPYDILLLIQKQQKAT